MNKRLSLLAVALLLFLTVGAQAAYASTIDLLGVGWTKATVTVLVKASRGVSQTAQDDVLTAINDWDTALAGVDGAPDLSVVTGVKSADIVIQMKVGGGAILGQAMNKTESPFSPVLKNSKILLSGKAFGIQFSSAGIRNVARQEIGHALGLGHSDDPDDVMYGTADYEDIFGETDVGISACDIAALDAIYPFEYPYELPASVTCS